MNELQLLMYVALVFFIVGTAYKAIKITRMPLHLRWDLYPIPHEKGKGDYGGSYYEEVDWWTKPAQVSISSEVKEMAKEILLIQSMYHNNRPLWIFSFPFHAGLYFSVLFVLLVYAGAALSLAGISVAADSGNILGSLIYYVSLVIGPIGMVLGGLGALGLLFSRTFKKDLRRTSVATDYLNLILLLAVFVTGIWAWVAADAGFAGARSFIASLISFSAAGGMAPIVYAHFVLAALFLLWLPFTHMTHFVGKYFTYHKVRWEDHPNVKGGDMEKAVIDTLNFRTTWSAPHIKTGATWAEAATSGSDEQGDQKE